MTLQELIDQRLPEYRQRYSSYQKADSPQGSYWYDASSLRYVIDPESGTGGWQGYGTDENGYGSWGYSAGPVTSYDHMGSVINDGFLPGSVSSMDDYARSEARKAALAGTSYAGQWFDTAVDLIRQIDPSATEEDIFRAAQRVSAQNPEPGRYMPRLKINELVANDYLSEKLGRPITLSDNPQFAQAVAAEEAMKHDGFSLRESWPYFAMFLGPWLSAVAGPALAGAIAGGEATTASTIAANAAIQGGMGAANAAVTGGDVLQGAATGAVAGGVGSAAPAIQGASQVGDFVGLTADQAKAVASATSAAVKAYASGGDPVNAAAMALAGSVAGNMLGNFSISDAAQKIASSVANGTSDTLITQASDTGDGVQISTADATTLGQGLPKENMSGFFDDYIDWDSGAALSASDPGFWDESMATSAEARAAAGGYLNADGSIGLPPEYQGSDPVGTGAGNMEGLGMDAPSETWPQYLRRLASTPLGQTLLRNGATAASGGLSSRSPLEIGLMSAPALAAVAYARNMSGPDTSRLESIYGQMDPAAALGAFDLQTNDRRSQLETNLARRNVLGSSFANDDLNTFNTARDVGRRNLFQSGLESQAKVATDLAKLQDLGTQRKVDLYGRALNSLGLAFGGSRMMGG